jgi:hypothetical protein
MSKRRGSLVTVAQAAGVVNRNPEAVRKAVENHGLYKDYAPGKLRFRVYLNDVVELYAEIEAAGR